MEMENSVLEFNNWPCNLKHQHETELVLRIWMESFTIFKVTIEKGKFIVRKLKDVKTTYEFMGEVEC